MQYSKREMMVLAASAIFLALSACGGSSSSKPGALAPPDPVTATASFTEITVDWPPVTGATSYNLYWDTSPGVTKTTGTQVPGATAPFVHTGLIFGTTYYYVVTSLRGSVEGAESTEVSALYTGPPPPSGVTATPADSLVTIDWPPVAGVTGYNLYWDTNPGVTKTTGTPITGVTSPFDHTPLMNGTTYYYVLTSLAGAVEGIESAEVSATPNPPILPAGMLDTSFGGQGWVTHNDAAGANWVDEGYGISIDSAGRILVTGYSMTPASHLAMVVWRLNDNGTLDTTFNSQGWVVFDGGGGSAAIDEGWSVMEDSSGRIVVVGGLGVNSLDQDVAVWRYLSDGSVDTTFGTNGLASHDAAAGAVGGEDWGWAGLLDSTGRIVVGGSSQNTRGDWDMVVWRFSDTGSLDTTFGTGGFFVHDSAAGGLDWDEALNITEDFAGRLVATGYSTDPLGDVDMVTWRVHATGVLDTTFGPGATGFVIHDNAAGGGDEDYGEGIVIDTSGTIFVSGISTNAAGNFDMVIWAYDNSGNLEPTFGSGGVVVHGNAAGGNDWDDGLNATLDRFGRVFVTGFSVGPRPDRDMLVWGYDFTGALDPGFATGGLFIDDNAGGGMGPDVGNALVIDPQDRLLVVGSTWTPSNADDMIVWRIQ